MNIGDEWGYYFELDPLTGKATKVEFQDKTEAQIVEELVEAILAVRNRELEEAGLPWLTLL